LFIFDVSDPKNPKLVGHCDAAGDAQEGVAVARNHAYVVDGGNDLVLLPYWMIGMQK